MEFKPATFVKLFLFVMSKIKAMLFAVLWGLDDVKGSWVYAPKILPFWRCSMSRMPLISSVNS